MMMSFRNYLPFSNRKFMKNVNFQIYVFKDFDGLSSLLFRGLASIAKIEMRYQTLTDKSIALLVENAKNLENLQVLDLQSCDIEGTMLQGFVRCFKNLKALIFSGNRLLSRAGVELGDSILGSKLEIIELADCGLTEDGIISMFSALHAPNCMIRKLDISVKGSSSFKDNSLITYTKKN